MPEKGLKKPAGILGVDKTPNNKLANKIEKVLEKKNSIYIRSAHEETVRKRQMTKVAEAMDRLRNRSEDSGWSGTREIRKWRDSRPKS